MRHRFGFSAVMVFAILAGQAPAAESVEYRAGDHRDPFVSIAPRPVASTTPKPILTEEGVPDFQLSGLVWTGRKPQAILNEEVVGIGATVLGYEVLLIERSGVKLRKGKREIYLSYSPTLS